MTYLRNQSRIVHETLFRHIRHHMGLLGWLEEATAPYGASPLTIMSSAPLNWETAALLEPGTGVVTMGARLDVVEQEMGSTLSVLEYPFFFDVFMENESFADAAADDVYDILKGRLPGTAQALKVWDFTQSPPVPAQGWRIDLADLERDHGPSPNWALVRATAQLEFHDTVTDVRASAYPSASIWATSPISGAAALSVNLTTDGGGA